MNEARIKWVIFCKIWSSTLKGFPLMSLHIRRTKHSGELERGVDLIKNGYARWQFEQKELAEKQKKNYHDSSMHISTPREAADSSGTLLI